MRHQFLRVFAAFRPCVARVRNLEWTKMTRQGIVHNMTQSYNTSLYIIESHLDRCHLGSHFMQSGIQSSKSINVLLIFPSYFSFILFFMPKHGSSTGNTCHRVCERVKRERCSRRVTEPWRGYERYAYEDEEWM